MTAAAATHAAFTIRNISGMWQGDCECGAVFGDYKDPGALVGALDTHRDEETR